MVPTICYLINKTRLSCCVNKYSNLFEKKHRNSYKIDFCICIISMLNNLYRDFNFILCVRFLRIDKFPIFEYKKIRCLDSNTAKSNFHPQILVNVIKRKKND